MVTKPPHNLERALKEIEARLTQEPKAVELQFDRACLLALLGRFEQAKESYLAILHRDPAHFGTLNNLAALLYETGFNTAARTVYMEAVTRHPEKSLAHVNFANFLLAKGDLEEARSHYETAVRLEPTNAAAHQGLSALFFELGDEEKMLHHRELGWRNNSVKIFPYKGDGKPTPLLLLVSSMGGEIPWRRLVDENVFQVTTLAPAFYDPAQPLPPYQLVLNCIGDADICATELEAAQKLLKNITAPVINPPANVLATGRMANAERLRSLPNVVTPRIKIFSREVFESKEVAATLASQGFDFPLLLRRPGFHTGKHFTRVDHLKDLKSAIAALPGKEVMAIEYLNAYGADGFARKYRIMMIGGRLYPLHLAISDNWKVHYFTAAMADNPVHQAEEAAFLNDMPKVLGEKAVTALHTIQKTLGLDFGGIDFGLDPEGNLLLFEANATMLIKPPDAGAQWDYRRTAAEHALEAARHMLSTRAGIAS